MTPAQRRRISKYLSFILRHRPDKGGIELDAEGWVCIEDVLRALDRRGFRVDRRALDEVVRTNDKQRFCVDASSSRIRAAQGHSIEVDLRLEPIEPPELLYHGTVDRFLPSIRTQGLLKQKRRHVHLSPDEATASAVGGRRGRPVVLVIRAAQMHGQGYAFFLSDNGVWLTEHVPPRFIGFPDPAT
ncbi:MAG: RNA 2'-phosphotransferase [Deltaproteobacteria bacterium]|nr:RNA 2'-phosphotransferase [Deltaproteobacteria bacterium]